MEGRKGVAWDYRLEYSCARANGQRDPSGTFDYEKASSEALARAKEKPPS